MSDDESMGRRSATIYDVAARAGVSHQTVSRVLRNFEGIRPATRDRVRVAIAELDYRTNVMARNLREGRTGMISLAIPNLNQPYLAELAQHVMRAARRHGLTVFVETTEGDHERELEVISGSRGSLVDGTIYVPLAVGAAELSALAVPRPLVLLGDRILHSPFDHVTMPNAAGARAAVEHLIAIGGTRIGAIGAESASDFGAATQRMQGYQEALAAAGIGFDERLTVVAGEWLRSNGVAAVESLLASGVAFDSLFCFNDALALGALRALYQAGLRVPEDVAVVGFDDTEDAKFATPSLTSISPGAAQIASMAVELLDRKLRDRSVTHEPQDLLSDFTLVVRESTIGTPPRSAGVNP